MVAPYLGTFVRQFATTVNRVRSLTTSVGRGIGGVASEAGGDQQRGDGNLVCAEGSTYAHVLGNNPLLPVEDNECVLFCIPDMFISFIPGATGGIHLFHSLCMSQPLVCSVTLNKLAVHLPPRIRIDHDDNY